jgi:hypothetical protein
MAKFKQAHVRIMPSNRVIGFYDEDKFKNFLLNNEDDIVSIALTEEMTLAEYKELTLNRILPNV